MQGASSAHGQAESGSTIGRHVQNPQHPNAAVLLVEPLPGRVDVGVVKAIASLAGAQPIIDVGHPKWLHVKVFLTQCMNRSKRVVHSINVKLCKIGRQTAKIIICATIVRLYTDASIHQ